jgi:hypothetical protein
MQTFFRTLLPVLVLALPAVVQAQKVLDYTNNYGIWSYWVTNGTTTLLQYVGSNAVVVIPDMIDGLPVTNIRFMAFYRRWSLINLTIPDSVTNIEWQAFYCCLNLRNACIGTNVTNIGYQAFYSCESLTSITLPDSVASIGYQAFYFCESLTSITLPDSVTSIGADAFGGCNSSTNITIGSGLTNISTYNTEALFAGCGSLTAITVSTNNPAYSSVDGVLFNKNQTTLLQYPQSKNTTMTSYAVPNGVTNIGPWALGSCTNMCSVIIPASVVSIGKGALCNYYYLPGWDGGATSLASVYFQCNHPTLGTGDWFNFQGWPTPIVYYLPGTTGWFLFTLWNPQAQAAGVRSNLFGFTITGTAKIPIVVEASVNLATGSWTALQSCTLTNGAVHFSDPAWTNYPARFYRIRSP